jgi:hypothetical protein
MVRSIGADHVTDDTYHDSTQSGQRDGLMLDTTGTFIVGSPSRAIRR